MTIEMMIPLLVLATPVALVALALTYALMLAFFRNEMGFGGNNGLTDFKDLLLVFRTVFRQFGLRKH